MLESDGEPGGATDAAFHADPLTMTPASMDARVGAQDVLEQEWISSIDASSVIDANAGADAARRDGSAGLDASRDARVDAVSDVAPRCPPNHPTSGETCSGPTVGFCVYVDACLEPAFFFACREGRWVRYLPISGAPPPCARHVVEGTSCVSGAVRCCYDDCATSGYVERTFCKDNLWARTRETCAPVDAGDE